MVAAGADSEAAVLGAAAADSADLEAVGAVPEAERPAAGDLAFNIICSASFIGQETIF